MRTSQDASVICPRSEIEEYAIQPCQSHVLLFCKQNWHALCFTFGDCPRAPVSPFCTFYCLPWFWFPWQSSFHKMLAYLNIFPTLIFWSRRELVIGWELLTLVLALWPRWSASPENRQQRGHVFLFNVSLVNHFSLQTSMKRYQRVNIFIGQVNIVQLTS